MRRRRKNCNDLNDATITKDVPFAGFMCIKMHLGIVTHQNV
jgi:hypothetical protein